LVSQVIFILIFPKIFSLNFLKLIDYKFKILKTRFIWVLRNYTNNNNHFLLGQIFLAFFFCLKIGFYYNNNNNSKIVISTRDLIEIEISSTTLEYNRERVCILYFLESDFIVIIIKDLKLNIQDIIFLSALFVLIIINLYQVYQKFSKYFLCIQKRHGSRVARIKKRRVELSRKLAKVCP
jgi:hypothetical protein